MSEHHIRYDLLAQAALRGVVRTVLADAAKNGLPGEHHFKIIFATAAPGVRLSERLRAQYPQSMMIILQHEFWDLAVGEDAFEVGLSFGGVPEKLTVPFAAITAFFDPSVQFGFQFEPIGVEAADTASADETVAENSAAHAAQVSADSGSPRPAQVPADGKAEPAPPEPAAEPQGGSGEVVRLDRFRKK
jgi:hypothetical protein